MAGTVRMIVVVVVMIVFGHGVSYPPATRHDG
jgi:hypothetical protein